MTPSDPPRPEPAAAPRRVDPAIAAPTEAALLTAPRRRWYRRAWPWLVLLVMVAGGAWYWRSHQQATADGSAATASATGPGKQGGFGKNGGGRKGGGFNPNATMPVGVATAKTADVPIYLSGLGSVTPTATVTVKARVDGQLAKLNFREGQIVKTGDVLAEIDPRPFEVLVTQAEGTIARDQALLANARVDLDRYRKLVEQDSIATQQLDTQKALVGQYEGTVKQRPRQS